MTNLDAPFHEQHRAFTGTIADDRPLELRADLRPLGANAWAVVDQAGDKLGEARLINGEWRALFGGGTTNLVTAPERFDSALAAVKHIHATEIAESVASEERWRKLVGIGEEWD